jgi:hypothetical protein
MVLMEGEVNDSRHPRHRRAKSTARNAITYAHVCGPELRPKGSMPIESHQHVGRLIKSVLADDWLAREFTRDELSQSTFFCLYYGKNERELEGPTDREIIIERVELMKKIVTSSYPDCAPLRSLLKFADRAIVMIRRRK